MRWSKGFSKLTLSIMLTTQFSLAWAETALMDVNSAFIKPPLKDPQITIPVVIPEETPEAFEARIQKHIIPRSFLYQQTVFSRYPKYRAKIRILLDTMMSLSQYLENLDDTQAPNIQMLSAKANLAKLTWENVARDLEPSENEYRSYENLTEAVAAIVNISDYWVEASNARALKRPSLSAMADDMTYWSQLRQATLDSIAKLKTWQAQEQVLTHNPSR